MWEIDLGNQITTFLLSLPLGGFFALAFFTLEAFRIANGIKGVSLWTNDILFFALAGFITFCFLLVRSNGEVRGYVLIGEAIGFWFFKKLFYNVYIKYSVLLIRLIKKASKNISSAICTITLKIYCKLRKTLKKLKNNKKKRLKMQEQLVYTETNNTEGSVTDELKGSKRQS